MRCSTFTNEYCSYFSWSTRRCSRSIHNSPLLPQPSMSSSNMALQQDFVAAKVYDLILGTYNYSRQFCLIMRAHMCAHLQATIVVVRVCTYFRDHHLEAHTCLVGVVRAHACAQTQTNYNFVMSFSKFRNHNWGAWATLRAQIAKQTYILLSTCMKNLKTGLGVFFNRLAFLSFWTHTCKSPWVFNYGWIGRRAQAKDGSQSAFFGHAGQKHTHINLWNT